MPTPRDRLLATAGELFYAEGIRAVGVNRLVEEAAVTRATFYRHFPGRDDLVVAYLRDRDTTLRGYLPDVPTDRDGAVALLRTVAHGIGDDVCRPGFRGCPFINAAAEFPDPQHPVRRAVDDHRRWFAELVTATLAVAGHPDPATAGRQLVMLRDGAMVAGYLADPEQARDTLVSAVEGLIAD
jgi:AcrR family transcriptional regulator